MLQLPAGYNEHEVLGIVKKEYESSIEATRSKRKIFKLNQKLYLNTEDRDTKILSKYIRSVTQTLRAIHYTDEINVERAGRQIGAETYAYNLNALSKFDYEEMKLSEKRLRTHEDKIVFGVSIEAFIGWDNELQCPITVSIDPMCRVPDMNADQNFGPRFQGFEMLSSKYSLTERDGYSQEKIKEYLGREESNLLTDAKGNQEQIRNINQQFLGDTEISIYHHYTTIGGEKYHITTSGNQSTIFRCIKLKPASKAQEKNPMLIQFPIVTRNWISTRYDPFGINIFDILADKQMALQLFDNLARIQAEHNTFGHKFLVDEDAVQDISQLLQDTVGPSYVSAKFENGKTPIMEVPRGQIASDAWNVRNSIQENSYVDMGMDARSMGISAGGNLTATENQRVQANSNLRLTVGLKEDMIGEKKFRQLWYSFYKLYFSNKSKKMFLLTNALGYDKFELERNDFISEANIDVKIKLKSDIEAERQKKLVSFMAMYGSLLQDPNLGVASRLYIQRYMLELQGFTADQIRVIYPYTPEEEQAFLDVELLNNNEDVGEIQDINEDHLVYIMIYDQAKDTKSKQKAINTRRKAYILSGQSQKQQGMQGEQGGDAMGNMITNHMMQQQPVEAESLTTNQ